MAQSSFWERLGRGVGYGWQKTRELSSELGDQIEGKMELAKAREALDQSYLALGKAAAECFVDNGKKRFDSSQVREALKKIEEQRALVLQLEKERELREAKEREEQERRQAEEATQKRAAEAAEKTDGEGKKTE